MRSLGQKNPYLQNPNDTLHPDQFMNTVEQSLNYFYADYANTKYYARYGFGRIGGNYWQ
jgi:hypothetical protein